MSWTLKEVTKKTVNSGMPLLRGLLFCITSFRRKEVRGGHGLTYINKLLKRAEVSSCRYLILYFGPLSQSRATHVRENCAMTLIFVQPEFFFFPYSFGVIV